MLSSKTNSIVRSPDNRSFIRLRMEVHVRINNRPIIVSSKHAEEVLEELDVSIDHGLSKEQVRDRQEQYGLNVLNVSEEVSLFPIGTYADRWHLTMYDDRNHC